MPASLYYTAEGFGDIQILNAAQNNSPCTTTHDYSPLSHYQARTILFKLLTSSAPENITQNLNFQNAALWWPVLEELCSWEDRRRHAALLCSLSVQKRRWKVSPQEPWQNQLGLSIHRKSVSRRQNREWEKLVVKCQYLIRCAKYPRKLKKKNQPELLVAYLVETEQTSPAGFPSEPLSQVLLQTQTPELFQIQIDCLFSAPYWKTLFITTGNDTESYIFWEFLSRRKKWSQITSSGGPPKALLSQHSAAHEL